MPSFLRLNGIAVPVALGTADLSQEDIGESARAVDGTPLFNRRAVKRTWSQRTTIRTAAEALAWRDLVTGKGHVVSFEPTSLLYTSKGLPPTSVGADFTVAVSTPKYGTSRGASAATATNQITYTVFAVGSAWTVALWVSEDAGATWSHYVVNSAGQKWRDGARNDGTSTTFLAVASGVATIGIVSTALSFDDIVFLPYLAPTDWPTQIYSFGYAFGLLPRLAADGLFVEQNVAGGISTKGKVGSLKAVNAAIASTRAANQHDFAFELLEV